MGYSGGTMLRRLLLCAAVFLGGGFHAAAESAHPLTVVELFTSQGCASCPPADAHLGELSRLPESEGILALSFHVDYWNNLGWSDPWSSAENTRRQRAYAKAMKQRYVYTPQMVVQGRLHATGSDRNAVRGHIEAARALPRIAVTAIPGDGGAVVDLPAAPGRVQAVVYMVVYDRRLETAVERGENAGKTVTNYNVVRRLTRIASWNGGGVRLSLPPLNGGDGGAVLVQSRQTGAILGAARLPEN